MRFAAAQLEGGPGKERRNRHSHFSSSDVRQGNETNRSRPNLRKRYLDFLCSDAGDRLSSRHQRHAVAMEGLLSCAPTALDRCYMIQHV